jgi:hypothetical protein
VLPSKSIIPIGNYFQTKKRLRQGDPLSLLLFNIVADMFVVIIERTKSDGQIDSVICHLVDGGWNMTSNKARNVKLLLAFEQFSSLEIHFHMSELFCFDEARARRC